MLAVLALAFAFVELGPKIRFFVSCQPARCRLITARVENDPCDAGSRSLFSIELLDPAEFKGRRLVATYRPTSLKAYSLSGYSEKKLFRDGHEYDCWVDRSGETATMVRYPNLWPGGCVGLLGCLGFAVAILLATGGVTAH